RVVFAPVSGPPITKDFAIRGAKAADGTFRSCHNMFDAEVEEGIAQVCKSFEGTWDEENKKCYPKNLPVCFLTDEASCGSVGPDDGRTYVASGTEEFSEYDYTVCTTEYKLKKDP